jgi:hypothetical protein
MKVRRKKREGGGGGRAPRPEVVWLGEPSPERIVRAQLLLLGKTAAEVDRAMRDEPAREEGPRRRKTAA